MRSSARIRRYLTDLVETFRLQPVGGSGDPDRGDRLQLVIENRAGNAVQVDDLFRQISGIAFLPGLFQVLDKTALGDAN